MIGSQLTIDLVEALGLVQRDLGLRLVDGRGLELGVDSGLVSGLLGLGLESSRAAGLGSTGLLEVAFLSEVPLARQVARRLLDLAGQLVDQATSGRRDFRQSSILLVRGNPWSTHRCVRQTAIRAQNGRGGR